MCNNYSPYSICMPNFKKLINMYTKDKTQTLFWQIVICVIPLRLVSILVCIYTVCHKQCYSNPPATSITVPVMYFAFVESRKAAVSAMSSGWPIAPNGICNKSICCNWNEEMLADEIFPYYHNCLNSNCREIYWQVSYPTYVFRNGFDHWCVDETRTDGVYSNTELSQFFRCGFCKSNYTCFWCRVVCLSRITSFS